MTTCVSAPRDFAGGLGAACERGCVNGAVCYPVRAEINSVVDVDLPFIVREVRVPTELAGCFPPGTSRSSTQHCF